MTPTHSACVSGDGANARHVVELVHAHHRVEAAPGVVREVHVFVVRQHAHEAGAVATRQVALCSVAHVLDRPRRVLLERGHDGAEVVAPAHCHHRQVLEPLAVRCSGVVPKLKGNVLLAVGSTRGQQHAGTRWHASHNHIGTGRAARPRHTRTADARVPTATPPSTDTNRRPPSHLRIEQPHLLPVRRLGAGRNLRVHPRLVGVHELHLVSGKRRHRVAVQAVSAPRRRATASNTRA